MSPFTFDFHFSPSLQEQIQGTLQLGDTVESNKTLIRTGHVKVGAKQLDISLYSNPSTQGFIYLRKTTLTPALCSLLGVSSRFASASLSLPGQLILGGERNQWVGDGVQQIMGTQVVRDVISRFDQTETAILPILREGVKYNIAEGIFATSGYYCDEVVVDAHHVPDASVAGYGRRVDIAMFKDIDMTQGEREKIKVAFIGDSTASGIVVIGILQKLGERFPNIVHVEVVAPLTTLFAASRIATYAPPELQVRLHMFETILNAQPPDYYWSPHYAEEGFHITPSLQQEYRTWWGQDEYGNWIADTACAGYGWSEAFFHPQKFVRMMNEELTSRHHLTIAQIIERNLS